MGELIIGIDDAGRGPVIGPMVVAGVLITKEQEKELRKLGVKDSKELTQKRREDIFEKMKPFLINYHHELIFPEEIDSSLASGTNLNIVEAIAFSKVLKKLDTKKDKIICYLDCPSVSIQKWADSLKKIMKDLNGLEIVCEHKADSKYISVGAASIIAKCMREKEMDKLKEKYGTEIGSGYPSDPATIKFLEKYHKKYTSDGIFRKSWATYQNVAKDNSQEKLF